MATKALEISKMLVERVRNGEYAVKPLPSGRKLAAEVGVSYVTARKAIERVVDDGWLRRNENGRLEISRRKFDARQMKIGFVFPMCVSPETQEKQAEISQVVARHGGVLRLVGFARWDDPAIFEALSGDLDGVFMIPPVDMPRVMADQLTRYRNSVVTLHHDLTHLGIPCVDGHGPEAIDLLIEHLYTLGHRSLMCLSTEPDNAVITERINEWWNAVRRRDLKGRLVQSPVAPFRSASMAAYEEMTRVLQNGETDATAAFCVSGSVAKGCVRALVESGRRIGHDVSVCSFGSETEARLMETSLTVVATANSIPLLDRAMGWFERGADNWQGSLMIRPEKPELFVGQSTGPISESIHKRRQ